MKFFSILLVIVAVSAASALVEPPSTCFHVHEVDASGKQLSTQTRLCINPTDNKLVKSQAQSAEYSAPINNPHVKLAAVTDSDVDTMWIFVAGVLVFWMQAGFAMLEAGSISEKNVSNILFKNLMDASIGAIAFFLFGFAFAYGGDDDNAFIGTENFGLADNGNGNFHNWFFQWAFAATAATIVSGCLAERCTLQAYFVYSLVLTGFVYPVVVHWCWDTEGWLSPFNATNDIGGYGFLDFAGSGIVHMVGGVSGLVGAWYLGPRAGRFGDNGEVKPMPGHNGLTAALGTTILWMGWYGFNGGSTLAASNGAINLASKVATTTTLSAAAGAITMAAFTKVKHGHYDMTEVMNGILAALVGITAPCAVVEPWAAIVIGVVSGLVYYLSAQLLLKLRIDDPLNAAPVHGFCGLWGVLATGIFSTDDNISQSYGVPKQDYKETGKQFGVQLVGAIAILAWTVVWACAMFYGIKKTIGLRVSSEVETKGLDIAEHGGFAFNRSSDAVEMSTSLDEDSKENSA